MFVIGVLWLLCLWVINIYITYIVFNINQALFISYKRVFNNIGNIRNKVKQKCMNVECRKNKKSKKYDWFADNQVEHS